MSIHMHRWVRGWQAKTLAVLTTVAAALALTAGPAGAYPGSNQTSMGISVYRVGSGNSPTQLTANQYIWNDVVFFNNSGQVSSVTRLWLVVQTDGNLVLYKHPSGGTQSVCWAVNQYQANAPSPHLVYTSGGDAELWWGGTRKWHSGAYSGSSIDISGWNGQLYIGNQPYTNPCY